MIKHEVTTVDELDELYDDSALTLMGLKTSDDSLGEYVEWINENSEGFKGEPEFWVITGEMMNRTYHPDRFEDFYPNDLHIVCVKLNDLFGLGKLALKRFDIGARWFDDVVDNLKN